jgi:hypothetical protein
MMRGCHARYTEGSIRQRMDASGSRGFARKSKSTTDATTIEITNTTGGDAPPPIRSYMQVYFGLSEQVLAGPAKTRRSRTV